MNKNILSFEEIKKHFEEIRDHEYFNPNFCKICNQIEILDLLTDEEQKVFGDHRWSKKYLKEVANYEGILEKFLTEIVLAILELKRLSLSEEFISIDDVDTYSKQYVLLLRYGDFLTENGLSYEAQEKWQELKIEVRKFIE